MGTVRKTITLTDLHSAEIIRDQWIKAQIAAGHFTNDSEYIRDLIRRDRERGTGFAALQAAVREGLDSGPSGVFWAALRTATAESMGDDYATGTIFGYGNRRSRWLRSDGRL